MFLLLLLLLKHVKTHTVTMQNIEISTFLSNLFSEKRRPERLLSRLKSMNEEMVGPRVIVIRPPKGPDGTKGFSSPRVPWKPPA